ncbi:PKD domain-containing protein [cf. Phormidesmis sp. LEGE 11477]|nr:PKD domain-containing protein [cf. Phormidesmis sp. LEGE 11477]
MSLVPESAVTHKAVRSGSWFSPNTWAGKKVPDNNANVMIADGVKVTYDKESDVQLKTVRVDGTLTFARNADTKMVVDTLINMPSGTLSIGTKNNPIQSNKTASIVIAGEGKIDTKWDPTQLSRGVVSHGHVEIFGADKTDFIALKEDAEAGDRYLELDGVPKGWRVGDKLVLGGTRYNRFGSHENNSRFGDEELTITEIAGNRVRFTNDDVKSDDKKNALRFDHTRPDIPEKDRIKLYVANVTRNVTFESKDSKDLPIDQRGHVMFMHNPDISVNNAGFYNLGRSDKSKIVDDPKENMDGSPGKGKNPRGRYSLHFHRTGADDINGQAAVANGNAIVDSPGWGIVHHDSYANLSDNVVFDVAGTGIAAESGNELGTWKNNLTIKTTGPGRNIRSREVQRREDKYDFGFNGEGYWVQGAAQVVMEDNVAISAHDAGITLFGDGQGNEVRDVGTILLKNLPERIQALFPENKEKVDITDVPLNKLSGFQSYNTDVGIRVWSQLANFDGQMELDNRAPNAMHSGRATIDDFTVWKARTQGINTDYSSNIDFVDGLIVGDVENPSGDGIVHNHATNGLRYIDLTVRGFGEGYNPQFPDVEKNGIVTTSIEDSVFGNNRFNLAETGEFKRSKYALDDYPTLLKIDNTEFEISKRNNRLPVPKFSGTTVGGLSATFDASKSYDSDKVEYPGPSQGIASYGWDFDGDGELDRFGRKVTHHFEQAGEHEVSLRVLDSQGATQTLTQTVEVGRTAYTNPFKDGDIDQKTKLNGSRRRRLSSLAAGDGWKGTDYVRVGNGSIELANTRRRRAGLGQVVQDDGLHKGKQTLSFGLKNIEGSRDKVRRNKVTVQLWGVNGQFDGLLSEGSGPTQAGTIPMTRKLLFGKTYGGSDGFFNFKDFEETVDLGNGYQHLVARVKTDRTSDRGDSVALSYFELDAEGAPQGILPITKTDSVTAPTVPDPQTPKDPNSDLAKLRRSPSLVAQFSFDEGKGPSTNDIGSAGTRHRGLLKGDSIWARGLEGDGIAFSGNGDVRVADSRSINLGIHQERTVSVWFKADEISNNSGKQVIYEEGGKLRGLNIYLDKDRLFVGGWNDPRRESGWSGTWLKTDNVSEDTWHHVSLVLDGDSKLKPNSLRGYLDGEQFGVGSASQLWSHTGGVGIGGVAGSSRFHDGRRQGGGLTGLIDEVSVFNRALNPDQIDTLADSSFL